MRPAESKRASPQPRGRSNFISYFFFFMANTTPTAARPAAKQDGTSSAPSSNRPLAVFRFGSISAAVFAQDITRDGKTETLPHISLQRAYRTSDGVWHYTNSLRKADLLFGSYALIKCFEFLTHDSDAEEEQNGQH
jgi:hypothetical protein